MMDPCLYGFLPQDIAAAWDVACSLRTCLFRVPLSADYQCVCS
jgi:hypothetical protein